jgi:hypothetical protein
MGNNWKDVLSGFGWLFGGRDRKEGSLMQDMFGNTDKYKAKKYWASLSKEQKLNLLMMNVAPKQGASGLNPYLLLAGVGGNPSEDKVGFVRLTEAEKKRYQELLSYSLTGKITKDELQELDRLAQKTQVGGKGIVGYVKASDQKPKGTEDSIVAPVNGNPVGNSTDDTLDKISKVTDAMGPGATVKEGLLAFAESTSKFSKGVAWYGRIFSVLGFGLETINTYIALSNLINAQDRKPSMYAELAQSTMAIGLLISVAFGLTPYALLGYGAVSAALYFSDTMLKSKMNKTSFQYWLDED